MALVVGVDSSTSATKVEIRDSTDGTVVGAGRSAHPATTPPRSEQDPQDWWRALELATHQALDLGAQALASGPTGAGRASRVPSDVAALSVAGQQHGLVALDRSLDVVRPAKLWNDTESAPDARELVRRLGGPAAWMAACGSVPVSAFTISKLAWLRRKEPAAFDRTRFVALPHDWLTLRMTGRLVTDRGDASGTGYWSPRDDDWRPDLLDLIEPGRDWLASLPLVLNPTDTVDRIRPPVADALRVSPKTIVGPGTGDNMAAALGLGLQPGDVAVSVGTSGTVFAVVEEPLVDADPAIAGFADATGRYLPLVCTLNASKVTDTFARLLDVDQIGFADLVAAAPPGAGGMVLLPYLDGERTPDLPMATGALLGIRTTATRPLVARACVEGVVCGLVDALDALIACGVDPSGRLVLTGGAARSGSYGRVLADLTGRSIEVASEEELVARGAAIQAAAVLTGTNPMTVAESWIPVATHRVEPDTAADISEIRGRYAAVRDLVARDAAVPGDWTGGRWDPG